MKTTRRKRFNPENWKEIYLLVPEVPAIYVFVHVFFSNLKRKIKYRVLYVGMSTNLRHRLSGHPVKRTLRDWEVPEKFMEYNYYKVFYLPCPEFDLREKEKWFIKAFQPPLNLVHRTKVL
jgi:excinuclease UvrABC nuclease subunit